jgi:hypothetical protein
LHHEFEKTSGICLSGLGGLIRHIGSDWNWRRRPEPLEPGPESIQASLQESKNHINIKKGINESRNMLQIDRKEIKGQENNMAEEEESCRKEEGSRDKPVRCNQRIY